MNGYKFRWLMTDQGIMKMIIESLIWLNGSSLIKVTFISGWIPIQNHSKIDYIHCIKWMSPVYILTTNVDSPFISINIPTKSSFISYFFITITYDMLKVLNHVVPISRSERIRYTIEQCSKSLCHSSIIPLMDYYSPQYIG